MRLLIVDDEDDFTVSLARGLREQGYATDVAADGEVALELDEVNDYDLVILDLNLPGLDGIEVCRRMRAARPALLILMLTARERLTDRILGLDAGADEYLVKPFHLAELTARLRALLRRDLRVRAPFLEWRDLRLDQAGRVIWLGRRRLELTAKEFGCLEYLLRHKGEIVSQEALLEHVWDGSVNPFSATVRMHIASLRRKLGDTASVPRYIETIIGQGYRIGEDGRR